MKRATRAEPLPDGNLERAPGLRQLANKRIAVVGHGREGRATIEILQQRLDGPDITVLDRQPVAAGVHPVRSGPDYLRDLNEFNVIIRSPGVPYNDQLHQVRDRVITPTSLFLREAHDAGATVIGVTGTKGKSTTAALIHAQLLRAGLPSWLAGNIGTPAISLLASDPSALDVFVLELSSFQLMDLGIAPSIAVITSFYPEHLDFHGGLGAYRDAKTRLFRLQGANARAYCCSSSEDAAAIAMQSAGRLHRCSADDLPPARLRIQGDHNRLNAALAFRVAADLGIPLSSCLDALEAFTPLEHRLYRVAKRRGIVWVDDTLSTIPEATAAALEALAPGVESLIVGGHDRGFYVYDALARAILRGDVRHLLLLPETGAEVARAVRAAAQAQGVSPPACHDCASLEEAVGIAAEVTTCGESCVLSPAAPSFNRFSDYRERAAEFRRCVQAL